MSEGAVPASRRSPRVYSLNEGVRVFRSGGEIRFRKGVWNFNEAIVRLTGQEERVVRFFDAVYDELVRGRDADVEAIGRELGAEAEELASYCDLLENLKRQQFLHDAEQRDVTRVVSALLGGNLSGFEQHVGSPRPVLFFTDSGYAREAAKTLSREAGLPLDLMDDEVARALVDVDLTSRTDAVQHAEAVARLEKALSGYVCVVGCVASPNLSLLRNLNRLLIRTEKPLVLGLIDGPFVSVLSTLATQTGCFECFEQRMLARLEDSVIYHRFVEATRSGGQAAAGPWLAPPLHLLTAAVISEAYLFSALGMLRLAGRIVNVYLPLLEIQVQDLLRVPYCPACGFISKAQMNELYTSSKQLVSEMLAKVELDG
jgi:thiazole/oxazole-forming peptide maturase SagC family component